MNTIKIRRAISNTDSERLKSLFNTVFYPEKVGDLAEIFFHHLPGMEKKYWFIAEDENTSTLVSAFALILWNWEMEGITLKVAEMGLVGTSEKYRGQGLMRLLFKEFDKTLQDEGFDFAAIQGIPGFYNKFGYHYAIPIENHINLPLHVISDSTGDSACSFRPAVIHDIPFLMDEDRMYRMNFSISLKRSEQNWNFLLTESRNTDYASELWIMEHKGRNEKSYFRVLDHGFGTGLIINEISETISIEGLNSIFGFCKRLAIKQEKPYIRLNLHNQSNAGKYAISLGAEQGRPYAWQIKIHDKLNLLKKMKPVLESRLAKSTMRLFTGKLRIDFFQEAIDMIWKNGTLKSVVASEGEECAHTFHVSGDMFPALCLGHRSWQELQFIRPDIFPSPLYVNPNAKKMEDLSGFLIDILFPPAKSWVYLQY